MFPKTYSRKDKYFWTSSILKRVTMTNCLLTYKYSEILHWHRGVKMNVRWVVSHATPATTFQISGFGVWVLSGIYILSCELKIYGKVVQLTLNNRGESGVLPPQCGWKSTHNFWPPPDFTTPVAPKCPQGRDSRSPSGDQNSQTLKYPVQNGTNAHSQPPAATNSQRRWKPVQIFIEKKSSYKWILHSSIPHCSTVLCMCILFR